MAGVNYAVPTRSPMCTVCKSLDYELTELDLNWLTLWLCYSLGDLGQGTLHPDPQFSHL